MCFSLTFKRHRGVQPFFPLIIGLVAAPITAFSPTVAAAPIAREDAKRAAIHPVATAIDMQRWLTRVPRTRDFPPDFAATLSGYASLYTIEMSTAPGCLPCGDLWSKMSLFQARYHWQVRTISSQEALLRSGRLGLPWVGHPVAWVRPLSDPNRIIPIAIGTDHAENLARNAYLAAKMLTGVRPDVGLRVMAKYTGIVGTPR